MSSDDPASPAPWSKWRHGHATDYDLGIEEEVMLLDPAREYALAPAIDDVLAAWPEELHDHASSETHSSAVELRTGVHATVADAVAEMGELRTVLRGVLDGLGLVAGGSGTHPSAVWHEMQISSRERHQEVYGSMRELARREPTFALHVHVGLPSGEAGIAAFNRLRAHVPMLLALSANSPFWQGRDTGLASARTPLFQAFPRVGIPRVFGSYGEYVRDAQSTIDHTAALVALVQSLVRLELVDGHADAALVHAPEVLDENRFLAARDGVEAELVDPVRGRAVSVLEIATELMQACGPHAAALGCSGELDLLSDVFGHPGPAHQRRLAAHSGLAGLAAELAVDFEAPLTTLQPDSA